MINVEFYKDKSLHVVETTMYNLYLWENCIKIYDAKTANKILDKKKNISLNRFINNLSVTDEAEVNSKIEDFINEIA